MNSAEHTHSNYCDMMFEINDKIFVIVSTANLSSQTVTLIRVEIQVGISTY